MSSPTREDRQATLREDASTRRRLLDAAAVLFAERGFGNTTVRQIIAEAGASNGAAIGYHFGNKERLHAEALAAQLGPLRDELDRSLSELEEGGAATPVDVTKALVAVAVRYRTSSDGRLLARLLADRVGEEPAPMRMLRDIDASALFDRILAVYRSAAGASLRRELEWRLPGAMSILVTYMLGLVPIAGEPATVRRRLAAMTDGALGVRGPGRSG